MTKKKRLDIMVHDANITESREMARRVIMAGQIYVDGQKADKPGVMYKTDCKLECRGKKLPYVSRGGLKLEKAIKDFKISLQNKITMDIGASTGGFTDCMLQNGARKVYAIDVGYGQLAWKLRSDPRVVNFERTNFRYMRRESILDDIDFFSVDVSFISLKLILPVTKNFLKENGTAVCLIKPQFEAGKNLVGKKGVVRDPKVHIDVINNTCTFANKSEYTVLGLDYSPIKGPEGNIEYLMYLQNTTPKSTYSYDIEKLVAKANSTLN